MFKDIGAIKVLQLLLLLLFSYKAVRWLDIDTTLIANFVKVHTIWEGRIKYNDKRNVQTCTCGKVMIIN